MQSIWIKRGIEPIECIVIGESKPIATENGIKKMLKVRKITACPHCTFDIQEDEIINIAKVLTSLDKGNENKSSAFWDSLKLIRKTKE